MQQLGCRDPRLRRSRQHGSGLHVVAKSRACGRSVARYESIGRRYVGLDASSEPHQRSRYAFRLGRGPELMPSCHHDATSSPRVERAKVTVAVAVAVAVGVGVNGVGAEDHGTT